MSRQAGKLLSRLGAPLLVGCVAALLVAPPALAASPLKIREVFPGSAGTDPKAEYVMLQMTADGQNDIDGQVVQFYDKDGNVASSFTIPTDVPNGQSQRTVLIGTVEAGAWLPGLLTPDFSLGSGNDRLAPAGGGVCLVGSTPADCLTWGSIPLATVLNPYLPNGQLANAAPIADGMALRRKITAGCPTYLDAPDDTNSSASDFAQVSPDPRKNSSIPPETPCPPDTAITTFPANPSNQASASFTYAASPAEPGATFQCKLDGEAFAVCPNAGKSYPGALSDGIHTFTVKAIGAGGEDPSPKVFNWVVDTKVPETTIDSGPPEPSGGFEARFTYSSSELNSGFRCQLDNGAIQVCSASGKSYFLLSDGSHVFRVWATDNASNEDPTPAERTFTVQGVLIDATPPDTLIASAPANPSPSDSATFAYSSTEQGSTFECSLNSAPFTSCPASGTSYSKLRNGSYLFAVRATDRAKNQDSVPAIYAWEVKAPLPKVTITKAPPGKVNLRKGSKARVLFKFKADKPGSSFRCRLGQQKFKACGKTVRLKASPGRHRFEVYAVDSLGNVGTEVQRRIFRVARSGGGGLF